MPGWVTNRYTRVSLNRSKLWLKFTFREINEFRQRSPRSYYSSRRSAGNVPCDYSFWQFWLQFLQTARLTFFRRVYATRCVNNVASEGSTFVDLITRARVRNPLSRAIKKKASIVSKLTFRLCERIFRGIKCASIKYEQIYDKAAFLSARTVCVVWNRFISFKITTMGFYSRNSWPAVRTDSEQSALQRSLNNRRIVSRRGRKIL